MSVTLEKIAWLHLERRFTFKTVFLIQGTLHLSVAKMLSKFDRCPVLWMSPFYYRWIKSPHTIGFILHFLWLVNDVHESRLTELLGLSQA